MVERGTRLLTASRLHRKLDFISVLKVSSQSKRPYDLPAYEHSLAVGVAVYVFFILVNHQDEPATITQTQTNFTLDGDFAYTFTHDPTSSENLEYNQLVFSQTGLSNDLHTVRASISGPTQLYMNFDYAMYTFVPCC